jgi:hypothetical protein
MPGCERRREYRDVFSDAQWDSDEDHEWVDVDPEEISFEDKE